MCKSDEIFDLHKIPDSELVKMLSLEIGKLKSEIDELKYNLTINIHPQSGNSEYIRSLEGQVKNLKNKLNNNELQYIKDENKILSESLLIKDKRISQLEKELFNLLKDSIK